MPRPRKLRTIHADAPVCYYKPQGVPMRQLHEAILPLDGLEALRLADVEALDQSEAAERMGISRPTFSRLLGEARATVARAITSGWALRIEGGPVVMREAGGRCRHRRRGAIATPGDAPVATMEETEE